jgi:hypothetical protein
MAFFPQPQPVRNSNVYLPVIAGTRIPLDGAALKAAIAATDDIEFLEFQRPPSDFAAQPPGA